MLTHIQTSTVHRFAHNKPSNIIPHIEGELKQFGIANGFCHEHITHKKQTVAGLDEFGIRSGEIGMSLLTTNSGLLLADDGLFLCFTLRMDGAVSGRVDSSFARSGDQSLLVVVLLVDSAVTFTPSEPTVTSVSRFTVLVSVLPSSSVTLVLIETVLVLELLKLHAVMTQSTTARRMIARIFFMFNASDSRLLAQARMPLSNGAVQPRAVFIGTIGMAHFFIDCPHCLRASYIAL